MLPRKRKRQGPPNRWLIMVRAIACSCVCKLSYPRGPRLRASLQLPGVHDGESAGSHTGSVSLQVQRRSLRNGVHDGTDVNHVKDCNVCISGWALCYNMQTCTTRCAPLRKRESTPRPPRLFGSVLPMLLVQYMRITLRPIKQPTAPVR